MRANLFAHYYEDTRKLSKQNLMAFTKASSLYQAKPSLKESSARVRIIVGEKKLRECLLQQGIYIIFTRQSLGNQSGSGSRSICD